MRTRTSLAVVLATVVAAALMMVGAGAAHANYPYPPADPRGVTPMAVDVAPPTCVTAAPAGTVVSGVNVNDLCNKAAAAASSTAAAGAIRFGFSKLGTPYSQDPTQRATTMFDCSSFVGRALNAGGAKIRKANGTFVSVFPYFGWTGAYVVGDGVSIGYKNTNMTRLSSTTALLPGDLLIQFSGSDPSNSAGNGGHALMYLGNGYVIQAGQAPDGRSKVSVVKRSSNGFNNEWHFRFVPVDNGGNVIIPNPTDKLPAAAGSVTTVSVPTANAAVFATLGASDAVGSGFLTAYPCNLGRPATMSLSYPANQTVRVTTVTRSDSAGKVCIYTSNKAHLTFDLRLASTVMATHNAVPKFDSTNPANGATRVPARTLRKVAAGIPNTTVVGTLTASEPVAPGAVAMVPCDTGWKGTSTLNALPGRAVSNTAAVRSDAQGYICIYTAVTTHVRWDQVAETATLPAANPVRSFASSTSAVTGRGPVPAWTKVQVVTSTANRTLVGNVTAHASKAGSLVVWPCAATRPGLTTLEFPANLPASTFVAVNTGSDGRVCVYSTANASVVFDTISTTSRYQVGDPERLLNTKA